MGVANRLPFDLLSSIDPTVPLDGVVLIKNTGAQLALWTRTSVPSDVVTVMASTLLASADMILETFGEPRPSSLVVESDRRCIFFQRYDAQVTLVLIAPRSLPRSQLRDEAYRITKSLRRTEASASPPSERIRVRGTDLR